MSWLTLIALPLLLSLRKPDASTGPVPEAPPAALEISARSGADSAPIRS
ncbi:hypothetical protein [Nitrococcus mobilis]|uniref:Uncharacterized protein n=1 Tax=Nitrococcus mobilis Nb-231 TaxID=314278 RepID=A4BPX4_9GAMM|nr:hypothetical protein [Nitrococcus mobilis]EAR22129.1 hypothetical protein NB231_04450 [Nitrococcus mobilis Nb-231]